VASLAELKAKWFIKTSDTAAFPPQGRHAGSGVGDHTDGNRVRAIRDGQRHMALWADSVRKLTTDADPEAEIWLTGWRLEGVATLGSDHPESDALELLDAADEAGVEVYGMISRHLPMVPYWYWAVVYLNTHGLWRVAVDNRFPARGSGHQKFTCFRDPDGPHCIVGSIDISRTRWDTDEHRAVDKRRARIPTADTDLSKQAGPTHDTAVLVEGPGVGDIERTFQERWNDSTRTLGLLTVAGPAPSLPLLPAVTNPAPIPGGTHSVQVLHTYGRASRFEAYSWSPTGEFTIWAAYLQALRTAAKHIYIEDQYFLPFDYLPAFDHPGWVQETDLHFQLGQAIRRGVKVMVLTPSNAEDSTHGYQKYQRDIGIEYLSGIAAEPAVDGRFAVAALTNGTSDIYVHSKLMIVDDEVVFIGSANWGRRSMTFDSEIQLAIVDEAEQFAADLRTELWAEHLRVDPAQVRDPDAGYDLMAAAAATPTGHLRPYPFEKPGLPAAEHWFVLPFVIEPYGGPKP
jgi:phosphatidylserine/phosphatidylglycerophosphate/cardiolipin synthase-like enzyme